jgi:hypothetical protein
VVLPTLTPSMLQQAQYDPGNVKADRMKLKRLVLA